MKTTTEVSEYDEDGDIICTTITVVTVEPDTPQQYVKPLSPWNLPLYPNTYYPRYYDPLKVWC